MKRPSNITRSEIKDSQRKNLRVTIKGFFYNKKREIFFFHREGRASLPGGGVDEDEKLHEAFVREVCEELHGVVLKVRKVRESPILKIGILPTTKPFWKGKRVYVLAVYLKELHEVTEKDVSHYDFQVRQIADAIAYIEGHVDTPLVSRKFYVAALRKLAKLKKWKI